MSKNRFHKGMHLLLQGREYVVTDRLPNGDLRLKDIATDTFRPVVEINLIDAWSKNQLEFLGDSATTVARRKATAEFISDLSALEETDPRKKELKRRHAYLKAIVELVEQGVTKFTQEVLDPLFQKVHAAINDHKPQPHWKTVYYTWYRTLILTEDIRALTPQYTKRGNFTRKFSGRRKHNYSEKDKENALAVAEIIDEVIEEKYLSRQRLTVAAVYDSIVARVADENLYRGDSDKLPIPSERSIYDVVNQLDEYEVIKARHGKRIAELRCGTYKRGPQPTRPLERVEIDHTKLDLFVIDPTTKLPIGRPTLTLAIDKYTRMILGFYISFHGPGFLAVMHCLRHAILPKTYVKELYPSVKHSWNVYGIPEMIVVDNGLEFHGGGFEDACIQIGMVPLFCPVMKPWFKAVVERYFGTLNRKLLHELPGTTFSNIFEREDYDPSKNAIITLDTLLEITHVFIIDYYSQRKHRGIKDIPALRWDVAVQDYPPTLPARREDLQVLLGDVEYRTIQPYGIALFDLIYSDDVLAHLRKGRKGHRFKIKYDPADISVIYVSDPDSLKFFPVPAENQEYTRGLSLWQHKVIQRYARRIIDGKIDVVALCRAKEKLVKIIERDWLKIVQSGPKSRMARFKNISQPNYEYWVGFAESTDTQILNPIELDRQQPYLNPMASHSNGLSDLGSAIPSHGNSELLTLAGDAVVEPRPIFNSEYGEATQKKRTKTMSPTKKKSGKKAKSNDNNGKHKGLINTEISQNDSDDDLDTTGWSIDELPRRKIG
jgi:putative transposase